MLGLGPMEVVVILVIALVIFGPGKLPEMGSALGKSIGEFRKATKEITEPISEIKEPFDDLKNAVSLSEPQKKAGEATEKKAAAPAEAPAPATVSCPECQAANEAESKFCGTCGAILT